MAAGICTHLIRKSSINNCLLQKSVPLLVCSNDFSTSSALRKDRINRAMALYLQKAKAHEKFLKEQKEAYALGRKHLANMMGQKEENMTDSDVKDAIDYLFPSGLYVPSARPFMKPPEEVFPRQAKVEFDITGRPFNFLFYTSKPNYSMLLHTAAKHLEKLQKHESSMLQAGVASPEPKSYAGSDWVTEEQLEKKLAESLFTIEYEKFKEVFKCLAAHPYSEMVSDFIMSYRVLKMTEVTRETETPVVMPDGSLTVFIKSSKRDRSQAQVNVKFPGTGVLKINGRGLEYFDNVQSREQVLCLLYFT